MPQLLAGIQVEPIRPVFGCGAKECQPEMACLHVPAQPICCQLSSLQTTLQQVRQAAIVDVAGCWQAAYKSAAVQMIDP